MRAEICGNKIAQEGAVQLKILKLAKFTAIEKTNITPTQTPTWASTRALSTIVLESAINPLIAQPIYKDRSTTIHLKLWHLLKTARRTCSATLYNMALIKQ